MTKEFKRKANGTNGNGTNLDAKKKLFIEHYLKDFNATRAYMRSYDTEVVSTAGVEGSALMKDPEVMAQIDNRITIMLNKLKITNEDIIGEYAKIAFIDTRSMFQDDIFIGMNQLNIAQQTCVQSIEVTEVFEGAGEERVAVGYKTKVTFYSRKGALETFMKYKGMLPTNNQNTFIQMNQGDKKIELTVSVDDFKEKYGASKLIELYKLLGSPDTYASKAG